MLAALHAIAPRATGMLVDALLDPELRGTALEYLESILPPDVRAQLWPLLEDEAAPLPRPAAPPARSRDEVLAALHLAYPTILEKLRQRVKPA